MPQCAQQHSRAPRHCRIIGRTMDLDLFIEGIPDKHVSDAIRDRVRRVHHVAPHGSDWRVTVSPSETRGQWDLGVQVFSTRHFASFVAPADQLPALIEAQLRRFLELPTDVQ